jgi:L-asparaginase
MPGVRQLADLRVLVAGGTIDKTYDAVAGTLEFKRTHVLAMLHQARVPLRDDRVETVLLKDSLDMVEADREAVRVACARAPESRLVITHGTDTMIATARHLASARLDKTIVLTGAMVPFTFSQSDGLFNLGGAVLAAQCLPPGVYVAMNGEAFPWQAVRKNRERGIFEPVMPVARTSRPRGRRAAPPHPRVSRGSGAVS